MIKGHFIVFEGIDGSGTTTQAAELKKAFDRTGLPAHVTAEPSGGPVGSMIRQILTGRLVVRGPTGPITPGWRTMALLFAADRQDHVVSEIEPNLRDGVNVITDRYVHSSMVYQSVASSDESVVQWISELNKYVKKPNLVFYLKVDPDLAFKRRRDRDRGVEIYEDQEFQVELSHAYDKLFENDLGVKVITIDGDRPAEDIAAECWQHVEELRAQGAPV